MKSMKKRGEKKKGFDVNQKELNQQKKRSRKN